MNSRFEFREKQILESLVLIDKLTNAVFYKDSLIIILNHELKDDFKTYIAFNRILTKWEKISFYLWLPVKDCKRLAAEFGFSHPYLFYEFLKMEDTIDSNKKLLSNSKQIAESKLGTRTSAKTNHDLLRWLFKNNPDRLKALKSAMKKHGH